MNLFPKQKQAHRQRRQCMVTEVEGGGQKSGLRMGRYTLLHLKYIASQDPVHSTGHVACHVSRSIVSASLRPRGL